MAGGYMGAYGNIWLHTSAVRVLSAGYGTIKSFLEKKKMNPASLSFGGVWGRAELVDLWLPVMVVAWPAAHCLVNIYIPRSPMQGAQY